MAHAAAAAPRCYVAPVRGGALDGDFVHVAYADPASDVSAFKARVKSSHDALADVNVGKMLLYGPWASADAVPEDVAAATKGRACDPGAELDELLSAPAMRGAARAYFLVRVVEETVARAGPAEAAGAGAAAPGASRGARRCSSWRVSPSLAGVGGKRLRCVRGPKRWSCGPIVFYEAVCVSVTCLHLPLAARRGRRAAAARAGGGAASARG